MKKLRRAISVLKNLPSERIGIKKKSMTGVKMPSFSWSRNSLTTCLILYEKKVTTLTKNEYSHADQIKMQQLKDFVNQSERHEKGKRVKDSKSEDQNGLFYPSFFWYVSNLSLKGSVSVYDLNNPLKDIFCIFFAWQTKKKDDNSHQDRRKDAIDNNSRIISQRKNPFNFFALVVDIFDFNQTAIVVVINQGIASQTLIEAISLKRLK